jgi:hypothetical protein
VLDSSIKACSSAIWVISITCEVVEPFGFAFRHRASYVGRPAKGFVSMTWLAEFLNFRPRSDLSRLVVCDTSATSAFLSDSMVVFISFLLTGRRDIHHLGMRETASQILWQLEREDECQRGDEVNWRAWEPFYIPDKTPA